MFADAFHLPLIKMLLTDQSTFWELSSSFLYYLLPALKGFWVLGGREQDYVRVRASAFRNKTVSNTLLEPSVVHHASADWEQTLKIVRSMRAKKVNKHHSK